MGSTGRHKVDASSVPLPVMGGSYGARDARPGMFHPIPLTDNGAAVPDAADGEAHIHILRGRLNGMPGDDNTRTRRSCTDRVLRFTHIRIPSISMAGASEASAFRHNEQATPPAGPFEYPRRALIR